jgi:hypothetical protein
MIPPFGPRDISGFSDFQPILGSQKNWFAFIYFGNIQFFYLPAFEISLSHVVPPQGTLQRGLKGGRE